MHRWSITKLTGNIEVWAILNYHRDRRRIGKHLAADQNEDSSND
jgi:hypothetical protein